MESLGNTSVKINNQYQQYVRKILYFGPSKVSNRECQLAIAYGIDEGYLRQMIISMHSVVKYNRNILFYVAMDKISQNGEEILTEFANKHKISIVVYLLSTKVMINWPIKHKALSLATYFRFLLFEVVPEKRLLYMDADILCLGRLDELKFPLQNNLAAAVPDLKRMNNANIRLELPENHVYFNAGVLIINLQKWRSQNLLNVALKLLKERADKIYFEDQDVLNILFHGKVKYLPIRYNTLLPRDRKQNQVTLLHFASQPKPWNKYWRLNPQCISWTRNLWQEEEKKCFGDIEKISSNKIKNIGKWLVKAIVYPILPDMRQDEYLIKTYKKDAYNLDV